MDEVAAQWDQEGSTGIVEAAWAISVRQAADTIEFLHAALAEAIPLVWKGEVRGRLEEEFGDGR